VVKHSVQLDQQEARLYKYSMLKYSVAKLGHAAPASQPLGSPDVLSEWCMIEHAQSAIYIIYMIYRIDHG